MDKQELEQEVIKLRMQLMLVASQQKRTKVANKDQHDKVPKETADIFVKINSIDMYSLVGRPDSE